MTYFITNFICQNDNEGADGVDKRKKEGKNSLSQRMKRE